MNKYKEFLDYFDTIVGENDIPSGVMKIYNELASYEDKAEAPIITETGAAILEFLQNYGFKSIKAKDIADEMGESSRKISGAMRKLVTEGFVEKNGTNPVNYLITEKGMNFIIKENITNE